MPVFYFHVCDGEGFCEDPQGRDLPNEQAARAEALRSTRSLMVDRLMQGKLNLASFIEVEAEGGEYLFTITFDEAVEIKRHGGFDRRGPGRRSKSGEPKSG
jgi:hypothetical protein